jgi:hypothetical protein
VVMMTDNQPKGYILYRRAELKLFGWVGGGII